MNRKVFMSRFSLELLSKLFSVALFGRKSASNRPRSFDGNIKAHGTEGTSHWVASCLIFQRSQVKL